MNDKQYDWFQRMTTALANLRIEFANSRRIDEAVYIPTTQKIVAAVDRLKIEMPTVEEYAAIHEFWDGEAHEGLEWLSEAMERIRLHFAPIDQDDDYFNEEELYEKEMDRRYHAFHGEVPWWAQ